MAYVSDGTAHRDSIEDEQGFVDWLNDGGHKNFQFPAEFVRAETRGGAQQIADAVAILVDGTEIKFSCKLAKKGIESTSFTLLNASHVITRIKQDGEYKGVSAKALIPFKNLDIFRDKICQTLTKTDFEKDKKIYTKKMGDACIESVAFFTEPQLLQSFIDDIKRHYSSIDYIVHTDRISRTLYFYSPEDWPFWHFSDLGYSPYAINAKGESHSISNKPTGKGFHLGFKSTTSPDSVATISDERSNLGLRIRLHHNNGTSAFFGFSDSNSNSYPVLKLQQDPNTVHILLDWIRSKNKLLEIPF